MPQMFVSVMPIALMSVWPSPISQPSWYMSRYIEAPTIRSTNMIVEPFSIAQASRSPTQVIATVPVAPLSISPPVELCVESIWPP